jgi:hypothetical protein
MVNIAARGFGAIMAPALMCTLAAGPALADPPVELAQRPGETTPAPAAQAQPRTCLPHDSADEKLGSEFGEKVLGRGVSSDGTLVEIFLSSSGTFTVMKTTPKGMSCVVDFGEGWQTLNQLESVGLTPDDLENLSIGPTPH